MLIVCPNCASSYRLAAESLGSGGRSVQCAHCHQVWFEAPRACEPSTDVLADTDSITPSPRNSGDPMEYATAQVDRADVDRADVDGTDVEPDLGDLHAPSATGRAHAILNGAPVGFAKITSPQRAGRSRPIQSARFPAASALPAIIGVLVVMVGGLVTMRHQVVQALPQTASLYTLLGMPVNIRGLQFNNVRTVHETQNGVPVLVVEGEIVGTGKRLTEVARLRLALVDRNGREIYVWTARPDRTLLPPGEALPFRARLASPPAEATSVVVRFADGQDMQAGLL